MNIRVDNLQSTMEYLQVSVSNISKTKISEDVSSLNDTDAPWPVPAGPLDGKDKITTNDIKMNLNECEQEIDTEENLNLPKTLKFGLFRLIVYVWYSMSLW